MRKNIQSQKGPGKISSMVLQSCYKHCQQYCYYRLNFMYTLYYLIVPNIFLGNEKRETKYDTTSVVACDDPPHEELDVHKSGNNDDTL
jgi:hypothetical protein